MKSLPRSVVISVALVALGVVGITWLKKPQHNGAIKIGVICARTGPPSFAGKPEAEVLRLLEKINNEVPSIGKKIVLDIRDSGGNKDKAINFLEQFSKDPSCVAIIGPTASGESIAVASKVIELSRDARLPILSLAASSQIVQDPRDPTQSNEWVFKFAQNDDLAARKLVRIIKDEVGDGKVAFLYSNDAFGKSGSLVFPRAAKDESLTLADERDFPDNLNTPDAVVSLLSDNLDGVVIWGSAPGPALLVRTLRQTRPQLPIFLSHGNASQEFIESVGSRGNGVIVVGSRVLTPASDLNDALPRDKQIREFQLFWESATHKPQSHFAGHAYDAFQMLRKVINDGHVTRPEIRSAIESYGPYYGITGTFTFSQHDHAGLDATAFEVYQIRDDRFVPYPDSQKH